PLAVFTQENGLNADGYREQSRKLPIADRLELAKQTVRNSADEAVLSAAVADLAKYAIAYPADRHPGRFAIPHDA
ncbi:MAG TPA: hypothetical protein PLQ35_12200, partial [bacterium]|nr:hypothetical protein [bacterium]HQL63047.1 hypothetical protein [bacterium]